MIGMIIQDLSLILTTTHQGGSPLQELGVLRIDEGTCSGAQSERAQSQPRYVPPVCDVFVMPPGSSSTGFFLLFHNKPKLLVVGSPS